MPRPARWPATRKVLRRLRQDAGRARSGRAASISPRRSTKRASRSTRRRRAPCCPGAPPNSAPLSRLRARRGRASSRPRIRQTDAGPYPAFPPKTPTPPRSSETRSKAIASSSPPIRTRIRRSACAPFSRCGERPPTGVQHRRRRTRREPTGPICTLIPRGRTSPTRAAASRCFQPSSSRRRTFAPRPTRTPTATPRRTRLRRPADLRV